MKAIGTSRIQTVDLSAEKQPFSQMTCNDFHIYPKPGHKCNHFVASQGCCSMRH